MANNQIPRVSNMYARDALKPRCVHPASISSLAPAALLHLLLPPRLALYRLRGSCSRRTGKDRRGEMEENKAEEDDSG